ncbi:hypothetical protein [Aestuariirhabdus litorea]|uniref:Thiamine-binding protein domain-containing protein n=1 Tax=Aestuariirhabdus litorea TaxID=2528527 RepID=A0A3P3VJY8_9GAMM|nr:hypothetical protein [Aestuariirhabdus litorea]RRJ83045.1 hypothetical protein D0544_14480 [Aestuariirhabdus litorea]RWW93203.1 hypothetical protein DZC74_14455 [Endozoicomonadaceae bacterium GTF-13]
MELSVEISFYPLQDEYKRPILALIDELAREPGLEVIPNRMSTQLFGDYDLLMAALTRLMKRSFELHGTAVFVAKFINSDRRPRG